MAANNLKTSNKSRMIKDRLKQADKDDRFISIANAVEKIQRINNDTQLKR